MKLRLALVASLASMFLAHGAEAQLPFPLPFGEQPARDRGKKSDGKKSDGEKSDGEQQPARDGEQQPDESGEDDAPERTYEKPEPRPLPEGPADVLTGPILRVPFDGIVSPGMGEYVVSALERAAREGMQAVLIELDTPGGLVSTTEKMVQAILASRVPVIVYVTPSGAHAASAGTFITLSAHVAAMAPATRIGAAHPVTGSGADPEAEGGKHMGRKVENDLVAFVEGIAKERNRNVDWAIDAVRRSISTNADRALELGVIDLIARDRAELLEKLDGRQMMIGARKVELSTRGAPVVEHTQSLREKLLNTLADPGVAMVLGVLGLIGIFVEIYHPGLIAPGVLGILCILCSLIAMDQLPIDLGGAILTVAGVGLLIVELYTPTHGILGVLGGVGLAIGLMLLIDTDEPGYLVDKSLALGLKDVLPIVMTLAGFILYLSFVVLRKQRARPVTGREAMIGATGKVLQPVGSSSGMVLVAGEYWRARSTEPLGQGEEIEVIGIDGLEVQVRRKK